MAMGQNWQYGRYPYAGQYVPYTNLYGGYYYPSAPMGWQRPPGSVYPVYDRYRPTQTAYQKQEHAEKKQPWYVTVGKEVLKTCAVVGASILGSMVFGIPGAIIAGSATSGAASAIDQKVSTGKINWGSVAIDTALGAIPGGLGSSVVRAGEKLLGEKMGIAWFKQGSKQGFKRAAMVGSVDGALLGYAGGAAQSAYNSYQNTGSLNLAQANREGFSAMLPGAIGGAVAGSAFTALGRRLNKTSFADERTQSPDPASGAPDNLKPPKRTLANRIFGKLTLPKSESPVLDNFHEVRPDHIALQTGTPKAGTVFRGAMPESDAAFPHLRDAYNVGTIIDLRGSRTTKEKYIQYERDMARNHGIQHVAIPLDTNGAPTTAEMHEFFRAVEQARQEGKSVYVHCKQGIDRTGSMIAAYQTAYQGMKPSKAYGLMKRYGYNLQHQYSKPAQKNFVNAADFKATVKAVRHGVELRKQAEIQLAEKQLTQDEFDTLLAHIHRGENDQAATLLKATTQQPSVNPGHTMPTPTGTITANRGTDHPHTSTTESRRPAQRAAKPSTNATPKPTGKKSHPKTPQQTHNETHSEAHQETRKETRQNAPHTGGSSLLSQASHPPIKSILKKQSGGNNGTKKRVTFNLPDQAATHPTHPAAQATGQRLNVTAMADGASAQASSASTHATPASGDQLHIGASSSASSPMVRNRPAPKTTEPTLFRELFGDDLSKINFKQQGFQDCYLLANLHSIFSHPQAKQVLDKIHIENTQFEGKPAYQVTFPAIARQTGRPKSVVIPAENLGKPICLEGAMDEAAIFNTHNLDVSPHERELILSHSKAHVPVSGPPGVQILERAYVEMLKKFPPAGRYSPDLIDTGTATEAMQHMFGDEIAIMEMAKNSNHGNVGAHRQYLWMDPKEAFMQEGLDPHACGDFAQQFRMMFRQARDNNQPFIVTGRPLTHPPHERYARTNREAHGVRMTDITGEQHELMGSHIYSITDYIPDLDAVQVVDPYHRQEGLILLPLNDVVETFTINGVRL